MDKKIHLGVFTHPIVASWVYSPTYPVFDGPKAFLGVADIISMMKTILLLSLVLVGHCVAAIGPKEIAAWKVPGERVDGQCAKYAFCLNYLLFQRGIESKAIAYDWSHTVGARSHAIVLFKLGNRWYGIDNESDKAVQLRGDTDLARAQSFSRRAWRIQEADYFLGEKVAGYMTELSLAEK